MGLKEQKDEEQKNFFSRRRERRYAIIFFLFFSVLPIVPMQYTQTHLINSYASTICAHAVKAVPTQTHLTNSYASTIWIRFYDQFSKNVVQIFVKFSPKNIQLVKEDMNFLSQFKIFEAWRKIRYFYGQIIYGNFSTVARYWD